MKDKRYRCVECRRRLRPNAVLSCGGQHPYCGQCYGEMGPCRECAAAADRVIAEALQAMAPRSGGDAPRRDVEEG